MAEELRQQGYRVLRGNVVNAGPTRHCLMVWAEGDDLANQPVGIVLQPLNFSDDVEGRDARNTPVAYQSIHPAGASGGGA